MTELIEVPTLRPARWGIWDAVITIAGALVIAVAVGVLLLTIDAPLPVLLIVGTGAPWIALIGWPWIATTRRGNGPVIDLRLRLSWAELGWGLLGGVCALVVGGVGYYTWRDMQRPKAGAD